MRATVTIMSEVLPKLAQHQYLGTLLGSLGIEDPTSCVNDWAYIQELDGVQETPWERIPNFHNNLDAIQQLEQSRPGAVRLLSSFYGIRHFGRYPTEMLADQFDKHGDVSQPYGIILSGAQDWCGSFTKVSVAPLELYEKVRATHILRVCEARDETELIERVAKLDLTYGEQHKIDFAVIQAHGSNERMSLNAQSNLGSIALSSTLAGVGQAFSPNACVALVACETGQQGGIAQALSRILKTTVVAPGTITGIPELSFAADGGIVKIFPDYHIPIAGFKIPSKPSLYISGEPATELQRAQYFGGWSTQLQPWVSG